MRRSSKMMENRMQLIFLQPNSIGACNRILYVVVIRIYDMFFVWLTRIFLIKKPLSPNSRLENPNLKVIVLYTTCFIFAFFLPSVDIYSNYVLLLHLFTILRKKKSPFTIYKFESFNISWSNFF